MKSKILFLVGLLALLFAGCQAEFLNLPSDASPAEELPESGEVRGAVNITIPSLSSALAKTLGVYPYQSRSLGDAGSKAILIIDEVDLELYLGADLVYEETVVLNVGADESYDTMVILEDIPVANGYTLRASIYNTSVSTDDPVLYGISPSFNVTVGSSTDVIIRPIPAGTPNTLDPTPVPAPTDVPDYASVSLDSCFYTGDISDPTYTWGGESWLVIDLSDPMYDSYEAIEVSADPADDPDSADCWVYMCVVDSEGSMQANGVSGSYTADHQMAYVLPGEAASTAILVDNSVEDTYYIGLVTVSESGASVISNVDVSFTEYNDDAYEENDAIGDATDITSSQSIPLTGYDLDHVWNEVEGGDWYFVTIGEGDPLDVYLEFDHDTENLDLRVYSWDGVSAVPGFGDYITGGVSETSAHSGPADPGAIEYEYISVTGLSAGNYYIWVYSAYDTGGDGCPYELTWYPGTGDVNLGFE